MGSDPLCCEGFSPPSTEPVIDMERETPRIYVALNDHQIDHQSIMVVFEGKTTKQTISIFMTQDPILVMLHWKLLKVVPLTSC